MSLSALATLAPYAVEGISLAKEFIELLQKDDVSAEDLEVLKAKFQASQARRDDAIAALDRLIAEKRR